MKIIKYSPIILLILVCTCECILPVQDVSHSDDLGEIVFANILFRHGDRTPIKPYPNDPYRDTSAWPVAFGQLTKKGMQQVYDLGRWFRSRYSHLLPYHYSQSDIYIRSSDFDRTLISAQANLAGLYQPLNSHLINEALDNIIWIPTPVHTVSLKRDFLFTVLKRVCPRHTDEFDKFVESAEFVKIEQKNTEIYQYLTKHSGMEIKSILDIFPLFDALYVENLNNKTLPEWTKEVFPEKLTELVTWQLTLAFGNKILQKYRIGPLLYEMVDHIVRKSRDTLSPDRKIWMYSGHDRSIIGILKALNILDPHYPPYAAALLIELRKKLDNQYFVTVSYKNTSGEPTVFTIPGCQKACPIDDFVRLTEDIVLQDPETECAINYHHFESVHTNRISTYDSRVDVILAFVVILTAMQLFQLAVTYLRNNHKCSFTGFQNN